MWPNCDSSGRRFGTPGRGRGCPRRRSPTLSGPPGSSSATTRRDDLDRLPDRMLHLVRLALRKGVITKGDAAETLGVSREEILQLLERPPAEEGERGLVDELGEVVLGG